MAFCPSPQMQTQPPPGRASTVVGPRPTWMRAGLRSPVARSAMCHPCPVWTMIRDGVGRSPFCTSFGIGEDSGAPPDAAGPELAPGEVKSQQGEVPARCREPDPGQRKRHRSDHRDRSRSHEPARGRRSPNLPLPRRRSPLDSSRQVGTSRRCGGRLQSSATSRTRTRKGRVIELGLDHSPPVRPWGSIGVPLVIERLASARLARPLGRSAIRRARSVAWARLRIEPTLPGLVRRKPAISA